MELFCAHRSLRNGRIKGRAHQGFTLVELLVVLGVVALVMALLLPSLKRAREASRRTACASNIRQLGAALTAYSNAWGQSLPVYVTKGVAGPVLWDIPVALRDELIKGGMVRKVFYCPTNQEQNQDSLWTLAKDPEWCVTGYFFFIRRLKWPAGMLNKTYVVNDPHHDVGQPFFPELQGALRPSESELVSDAVISTSSGNFNSVGQSVGSATNHVDGNKPTGGNIVFHDGHVEWRPFGQMQKRLSVPSGDMYW